MASDKQEDVRNFLGSARAAIRSLLRRVIKSGDIRRDLEANDFLRLVAFLAEHKARAAVTFRRPTKVIEDGVQLMHLNYLLAFDGIIASRGGIPLIDQGMIVGAIGWENLAASRVSHKHGCGSRLYND